MDDRQQRRFAYRLTKDGAVRISWGPAVVTTLRGDAAARLAAALASADEQAAQLLMAKATGNFKRGNERGNERRGRSSAK